MTLEQSPSASGEKCQDKATLALALALALIYSRARTLCTHASAYSHGIL